MYRSHLQANDDDSQLCKIQCVSALAQLKILYALHWPKMPLRPLMVPSRTTM